MTWETPDGPLVLRGPIAELVRQAAAGLLDAVKLEIELDIDSEDLLESSEVELFERLTPTQQIAMLHEVSRHLLHETDTPMELTAISEATVYAIYRFVFTQIEIEIDTEEMAMFTDDDPENIFYWRDLTLEAYRWRWPEDDHHLEPIDDDPDADYYPPESMLSDNVAQWELIVEALADDVLWDRDFEMADAFLDAEPERAAAVKAEMGIDAEYFRSIPVDLPIGQMHAAFRSLEDLLRFKPR